MCQSTPLKDVDRVVIVQNANGPISVAITKAYTELRGVHQVVTVKCPDGATDALFETIDLAKYQQQIEKPLRAFLASHSGVDFIVLTKGVPLRLRAPNPSDGVEWFSLDSHLAALDYDKIPAAIPVVIEDPEYRAGWVRTFHANFKARAWANRFWNSKEHFSHAKFGGYLVTRLDGYTQEDAIALIKHGLEAERSADAGKVPQGEVLLNTAPKYEYTDKAKQPYSILSERKPGERVAKIVSEKAHLGDFNSDIQLAADQLKARNIPVELKDDGTFQGDRSDLMGYFSWGSNDPAYTIEAYRSLKFAPGAISDTAVSTGARTFFAVTEGQSVISDLIAQGVTGIKGYSDEPLVQAVAWPSIVFDRYTKGWTLAESLYAGSALVAWEDIVIGDPIARAYPKQ
jgi:uncharacterized protein (TIGR03790 family)